MPFLFWNYVSAFPTLDMLKKFLMSCSFRFYMFSYKHLCLTLPCHQVPTSCSFCGGASFDRHVYNILRICLLYSIIYVISNCRYHIAHHFQEHHYLAFKARVRYSCKPEFSQCMTMIASKIIDSSSVLFSSFCSGFSGGVINTSAELVILSPQQSRNIFQ